ncbi:hypothetical protein ACJX0J_023194, partial [Zea mays]
HKEHEMEIGYPTDVKHVAHIGLGTSDTSPRWSLHLISDFKAARESKYNSFTSEGKKWISLIPFLLMRKCTHMYLSLGIIQRTSFCRESKYNSFTSEGKKWISLIPFLLMTKCTHMYLSLGIVETVYGTDSENFFLQVT